jgi:hypothetical protein
MADVKAAGATQFLDFAQATGAMDVVRVMPRPGRRPAPGLPQHVVKVPKAALTAVTGPAPPHAMGGTGVLLGAEAMPLLTLVCHPPAGASQVWSETLTRPSHLPGPNPAQVDALSKTMKKQDIIVIAPSNKVRSRSHHFKGFWRCRAAAPAIGILNADSETLMKDYRPSKPPIMPSLTA